MTSSNRLSLLIGLAFISLALLWTFFSRLVVPPLIESAYRGESVEILNNLISGQTTHSVQKYLTSWESIEWHVLKVVLVSGMVFFLINRPEFATYLTTYRITLIWSIFLLSVTAWGVWNLSGHWQKAPGWEPEVIALSLAGGHGFSFDSQHRWLFPEQSESSEYFSTAWSAPVYPALMAAFFYVFSESGRLLILVFQLISLTCTSIVLFLLGRMVFNFWTGILAGSILMVLPQAQIHAVNYLNSAPFGGLMVSISACMILWCLQNISVRRGLILGMVLGLTMLSHGGSLLFLPVSALVLLSSAHPFTPMVWKTALSMVIACVMVVGPWTARNLLVFEELVPVRTGSGYIMYLGNPLLAETFSSDFRACSKPPPWKAGNAYEAVLQTRKKLERFALYNHAFDCIKENAPNGYEKFNEAKRDKIYMNKVLDFVSSEPLTFLQLTSQKFLAFFYTGWPKHLQIVSLLALVGALITIRSQKTRVLALLALAYSVPYTLSLPCFYRYRYPIEPLLLLLASSVAIFSVAKLNELFRGKLVGTPENLKR